MSISKEDLLSELESVKSDTLSKEMVLEWIRSAPEEVKRDADKERQDNRKTVR